MTEPNDFVKRVLAEHEEMRKMLERVSEDFHGEFCAFGEWRECGSEAHGDINHLLDRVSEVHERTAI